MRSRPEAGSTDQDWGEKRAQNMVTVEKDGAKQAVLRMQHGRDLQRQACYSEDIPSFAFSLRDFQVGSYLLSWQNPTKQERRTRVDLL